MASIIASISTLLGVIITFIGSYFLNNNKFKIEHKAQNSLMVHNKLEEICQAIENIRVSHYLKLFTHYSRATGKFHSQGKIGPYGIMPDNMNPLEFPRVRMLIDFYAPSLIMYYSALLEINAIHSEIFMELVDMPVYNKDRIKSLQDIFTKSHILADRIIDDFIKAAAQLARDIRNQ